MDKNKLFKYFDQPQLNNENFNSFTRSHKKISNKKQNKNQSAYINSKKELKPLPHILEQYQYKITNQLLLFKIMNPKRDKLIIESFHKSCSRPDTKKRHHLKSNSSLDRPITRQYQTRTFHEQGMQMPGLQTPQEKLKRSILLNRRKTLITTKGSKSYQKQFNIILQNQRMGKRIVNTKSSVQQALKKTFYTYKNELKQNLNPRENSPNSQQSKLAKNSSFKIHSNNRSNNGHLHSVKINSGVKVFFNKIADDNQEIDSNNNRNLIISQIRNRCTEKIQQRGSNQNQDSRTNDLKPNSLTFYEDTKPPQIRSIHKLLHYPSNQTKSIIMPPGISRDTPKTSQSKKRFPKQSFQNSRIFSSLHNQQGQNNITNCDLQFQTHFPQSFKLFGHGPTILMLYNLQIKCNPRLKDDSLLLFELITHQRRINIFKTKQKTLRTTPICYDYLRYQNENPNFSNPTLNCLKFCINISQIGDFIPLRLYKINGVQLQELGIIDIDLSPYKYRKVELDDSAAEVNTNFQHRKNQDKSNSECRNQQQWQQKQGKNLIKQIRFNQQGQKLQRDVVYGKINTKLRKRRLAQVDIDVSVLYKIYSKKFKSSEA